MPGRSSPQRTQETPQDCLCTGSQRQGIPQGVAGDLRGRIRQKRLLCARERVKAGALSNTHLARPRQDLDRHADTHRPEDRHVHTLRESCARPLRPDLETSLRKTMTVTRILTRVSIETVHPGGPSMGSCRKEGDCRAHGGEHLLCLLHPPPPASAFAGYLCEGDPCRRWVEGWCFQGHVGGTGLSTSAAGRQHVSRAGDDSEERPPMVSLNDGDELPRGAAP